MTIPVLQSIPETHPGAPPRHTAMHKEQTPIPSTIPQNQGQDPKNLILLTWVNMWLAWAWEAGKIYVFKVVGLEILVWNTSLHPLALRFPQGLLSWCRQLVFHPTVSPNTSTSFKTRVGSSSSETQSQPFPVCFSHLFLTACSCHLDLSGLDLVIPDVVWHFQFIRNAFVYLLGGFFSFFSFFFPFP